MRFLNHSYGEFFSVSDAQIYLSVIFDDWAGIVDGELIKGEIP